VHSGTKFFSGHADTMGGLVLTRDPELERQVAFFQNAEGSALAPFDCWLFLRGIKTLGLRLERQNQNARAIARFLVEHPRVTKVHYPHLDLLGHAKSGIPDDQIRLHDRQTISDGGGSLISFETGDVEASRALVEACKILKITVSFGSVNSLIEMPTAMSHASIPAERCTLPKDLVRISLGIEDVRDIQSDLEQALAIAGQRLGAPAPKTLWGGDMQREASLEGEGRFDSKFEELPITPK
jgi:cysteine-S-conjugate beta-lyase